MVMVIWVACPNCENEFYVRPELERYDVAAQCPFCKTAFKLKEAKKIIRPSPVISIK